MSIINTLNKLIIKLHYDTNKKPNAIYLGENTRMELMTALCKGYATGLLDINPVYMGIPVYFISNNPDHIHVC